MSRRHRGPAPIARALSIALLVVAAPGGAAAADGDGVGVGEEHAAEAGDPAADAEPGSVYAREGPYVGVGGHFAAENFDVARAFAVRDSGGVGARVGYRSHPNLAGEIVYEWISPFDVELAGRGYGEVEMHFVSMNARWLPLTGRVQPFLSAGVGLLVVERDFVLSDETDTPAAGRFGGGVDLYLSPRLVLSAEAVYVPPFDEPVRELDFVIVGASLAFRF